MNDGYNYIKIPNTVKKMNDFFVNSGFQAYLVGGAVRDTLLKKSETDWDIATNATPEQVMKIFKKVIPTGIEHGTVTVLFMGKSIEVTTFRAESDYSDGRHPDEVNYVSTIEDDLSRRDFTMNAIAINLNDGKVIDPFCGRQDIKDKIIKTVGNPVERFTEDGLRPIRAIRFASQLKFAIEENTFKSISLPQVQEKIKSISIERFRDELRKILKSEKPSVALKLLEKTGLLKQFLPNLQKCRNCIQADYRQFHEFDVLDHLFYACDGAPQQNEIVRLASLFHDVGKVDAKKVEHLENADIVTFYNHESYSCKIAKETLTFLKFPNSTIEKVCHLVKNHMFHYESIWTDSAVRRFIIRVGLENIKDLYDLRLADVYGMHNIKVRLHDSEVGKNLCELKDRIENVMQKTSALSIKDLAINGKDLIENGIKPSKTMGKILEELLNTVLEDPSQNQKETLLKIAMNIYKKTQVSL